MKRNRFKTDPELMVLIQPLDRLAFMKLQDELIRDGCRSPIYVWKDTIIGGIEEYGICCRLNLPFNVRRLALMDKYEVMSFICDEQLKRHDLRSEVRKYLFGKKYECELKKTSSTPVDKENNTHKKPRKKAVAAEIGMFYSLVPGTILKYNDYKTAIDSIRHLKPELADRILAGQLKVSHENTLLLGRLSEAEMEEVVSAVREYGIEHLGAADISRSLKWKQPKEYTDTTGNAKDEEPLIRKMPEYDPDSEIRLCGA